MDGFEEETTAPRFIPTDDDHDLDTLTVDQLRGLLIDDEGRLDVAARELAAARAAYRHFLASASSADAQAALEAERGPILERAEADVAATAEAISRNAHAAIRQAQVAPPALSTDDLRRANELRHFVHEDVDTLPLAGLRDAVRHALAVGDVPALFLYSRSLPRRLDRERSDPSGDPGAESARLDLARLAREASDRLPRDKSLAPVRARAETLLHRAQDLRNDAGRRRSEADARHAMEVAIGGAGVPLPAEAR